MDDPEVWRWIWLVAAVLFAIGEMGSPGSFFLLPFAAGAATPYGHDRAAKEAAHVAGGAAWACFGVEVTAAG